MNTSYEFWRQIQVTEEQQARYGKYLYLMMLRALPEDTVLEKATHRLSGRLNNAGDPIWDRVFYVSSKQFQAKPIETFEDIPFLPFTPTDEWALKEQQFDDKSSGNCICDLAYTGAKTHRKDCPVK